MIEFKLLNKAGLKNFINSPEFKQMPAIPITRHRALSHINNPRADENDVLLVLAYSEREMVGYIGILPELISIDGEKYKCGSLSCIWVDPKRRGMGVASKLAKKAHELYERLIAPDYVPVIRRMYLRTGIFTEPNECDGVRVYMRMDLHQILPPKRRLFQVIKPLLHVTDELSNFLLDARFLFLNQRLKQSQVEYVKEIDKETANFIHHLQQKDLFKRNQAELNWILKYPWVLPKFEGDRDSSRYAFASTDKSFEYLCVKLRDGQKNLVAFVMLSKRNRVLRTPYCYVLPQGLQMLANLIIHHLYKWRINTFITYHNELTSYFLKHKIGQIYKKRTQRPYLFSKELDDLLANVDYEIQDGDVDAVFT